MKGGVREIYASLKVIERDGRYGAILPPFFGTQGAIP